MSFRVGRQGFMVFFALGLLLSVGAGLTDSIDQQSDCTVMVTPEQSIQKAIDEAKEGAVICLAAGTWEENIEINKELTLRGAGRGRTVIRGKSGDKSVVIEIMSDLEIRVGIESLTAKGGFTNGVWIGDKAKVTITNSQLSENWSGIGIGRSAEATIIDSQLSHNYYGIYIRSSAQVTIADSQLSDNEESGIVIGDSAQVTIAYSQISYNGLLGIWMLDSAQATIANSTLSGNIVGISMEAGAQQAIIINSQLLGNGISIGGSAQATIINSQLLNSKYDGISIFDSAQVEIRGSAIEGNGTRAACKDKDYSCDGIEITDKSQVKIINSTINNNADWGVVAQLQQCGYEGDYFTGKVVLEGTNIIDGNNRSGNQNGMGNPGNHPWNNPNVPDGQVCLP